MREFLKGAWKTIAAAFAAVFSVALWTFWLALAVLLGAQVWWLATREMSIPRPVLRTIEERVAASGLTLKIGRSSFDPTGHILVEDITLSAPSFNEPLVTARAAYVRVDPWLLAVGRFEPTEIRLSDLTCFVPAMMSASGRPEPLLRNLTATIVPSPKELFLPRFSAQLADLDVVASGSIRTDAWPARSDTAFPFSDYLVRQYPQLSRRLADYTRSIALLESPRLEVRLEPSETAGAVVHTTAFATALSLARPFAAQAAGVVASTVIPLRAAGEVPVAIDASADAVKLPREGSATGVRAVVNGTIRTDTWAVAPGRAVVAARSAGASGLLSGPVAVSARRNGQRTLAEIVTEIEGTPVAATADLDVAQGAGRADFQAAPTAALLRSISRLSGSSIDEAVQLGSPARLAGTVRLAPGWKLESASARVEAAGVTARGLTIDAISGDIRVAGTKIEATGIDVRVGANRAAGSYTMDTASRDYRFLLGGRLLPLDISPWFRDWWPRFFGRFEFSQPVSADADVQGRWGSPFLSTVFVSAAVGPTAIEKVPFDSVETRMFIRPDFYDALDFRLTRGGGVGTGTFTRAVDLEANAFRYMTFAVDSTLDEQEVARIFGDSGIELVAPFRFNAPPRLKVVGRLDGPAAENGRHQSIDIDGQAAGPFTLYGFPLTDPVFKARIRDDDLLIDPVSVRVATGTAAGRVHQWGRGPDRQLEFSIDLREAKLGPAVEVVGNYLARRNNQPPPGRSALVDKAAESRLDLSATARGRADDVLSFHGSGQAEINGPQLGEVRLLGELSRLLSFTSLRFTRLQTGITIDGPKLVFPNLVLSGANSQVDAKGAYSLDSKTLDFLATVSPFGRSRSLVPALVDTVLKPITEAFDVQLQGTFDEPKWGLTLGGPNETLRALLEHSGSPAPLETAASPAPAAP